MRQTPRTLLTKQRSAYNARQQNKLHNITTPTPRPKVRVQDHPLRLPSTQDKVQPQQTLYAPALPKTPNSTTRHPLRRKTKDGKATCLRQGNYGKVTLHIIQGGGKDVRYDYRYHHPPSE